MSSLESESRMMWKYHVRFGGEFYTLNSSGVLLILLSMGAVFGIFTGVTLWWSFFFGLTLSKFLMTVFFWSFFFGVNLTFFPLHFAGLQGFVRKSVDYPDHLAVWNWISSIGSLISVFSLFVFLYAIWESFYSFRLLLSQSRTVSTSEFSYGGVHFIHSFSQWPCLYLHRGAPSFSLC